MENLILINRKLQETTFGNGRVWKTCLRQILFTHPNEILNISLLDSDQIFSEEKAMQFLIEVLCGLDSPVFGETEVFGQFKNFIDQPQLEKDESFAFNSSTKWVRYVLEQVKSIRTESIVGIGSNSYGSTLRKLTRDNQSLSIIGAGQLATEILPWIAKNKKIQMIVRDTQKYKEKYNDIELELVSIPNAHDLKQVLIIAAPIDNKDLIDLINNAQLKPGFVYDLRDRGFEQLHRSVKNIKMLSLSDFFEIFSADKIKFELLKKEIKKTILKRTYDFYNRTENRPHGWDDLC